MAHVLKKLSRKAGEFKGVDVLQSTQRLCSKLLEITGDTLWGGSDLKP